MKNIISILLLSLLCSCEGVFENKDNCASYFQIPYNVSPLQLEYHIGDTITVTSKFYKEVPALNIKLEPVGTFDMTGIVWHPVSFIRQFDTIKYAENPNFGQFDIGFDFIYNPHYNYSLHSMLDGGNGIYGAYNFVKDSFELSYKFVCKKVGSFILSNGNDLYIESHFHQEYPGKCKNQGFETWGIANNNSNNNLELLSESPIEYFNTWSVGQEERNKLLSKSACYCFKVVP